MCRSIKTLFNFEPPATEIEIREVEAAKARAASLARFGAGRTP